MSTATIGYKQQDGTLKVVYCHRDDNPAVTVQTLSEHYDTLFKVEQLIERGNLFRVVSEYGQVVYFVDRGMKGEVVAPTVVADEDTLLQLHKHNHFYLFVDNGWKTHIRGEHKTHEWRQVNTSLEFQQ